MAKHLLGTNKHVLTIEFHILAILHPAKSFICHTCLFPILSTGLIIEFGGLIVLFLDKKIVPKSASDIKLINAGKILENGKTVAQCKAPFDDLPKSVITMHVVVQPSPTKARPGLVLYTASL